MAAEQTDHERLRTAEVHLDSAEADLEAVILIEFHDDDFCGLLIEAHALVTKARDKATAWRRDLFRS